MCSRGVEYTVEYTDTMEIHESQKYMFPPIPFSRAISSDPTYIPHFLSIHFTAVLASRESSFSII